MIHGYIVVGLFYNNHAFLNRVTDTLPSSPATIPSHSLGSSFQINSAGDGRGGGGVLIGHVAAAQRRSHQWCISLTPINTKTIGRMTCHCFLLPISRDLPSSSYTTHVICYCSQLTTRLSFSLAGNKLYALLIPI